jgi:hypothetical protein
MDPLTGWLVGTAVFVLGGVVGFLAGHVCCELAQDAMHAKRAPLAARTDCLEGRLIGTNVLDDEARAKLDELAEHVAVKLTEAETRVTGLVNRVVELEKRGVYDDTELRCEFDAELRKAREKATEQVDGLRKRTSEKFSLRDRKIEDLYGRVGVLIERTDVLSALWTAPAPIPAPTQNTVKPKPRKKVA